MGLTNFSIFTVFKAKDGVTPVFKHIIKNGNTAGLSISKSMSRAKTSMLALKSACITVTGAIAAVGAFAPLKAFSDWEKGVTQVYTLLNDKKVLKEYGATIKELSKEGIRAGLSVNDVNTALFNTISAMGASQKSLDTYKQALVLAKGGCADLSTSVEGLTAIINSWGQANVSAEAAANALFTAQRVGVTNVQELASSIGDISSTARSAGVSMEETLATMAALTKGGMSTANATTSLTAVLGAFIRPTDKAKEVLKQYGIASDIVELKEQGLSTTFEKLLKLQKEHPTEIARAIPKLKALSGVLTMTDENMSLVSKTVAQMKEDLKNGTGLKEGFNMMNSTGAATMSKVMGELQVALIELGELAAPYLLPVVKGFGDLVHWLNEMLPKLNKVGKFLKDYSIYIISIVSGISGMLALKTSVEAVTMALKWYNTVTMIAGANGIQAVVGFKKLAFVLGGYTSALWKSIVAIKAQTVALLTNPWTWVAVGIGLVVAGVILLWKNWDKVTEAVKNWYNTAKTHILSFWEKTKEVFNNIGNYLKTHFIELLFSALNPIGAIIMGLKNVMKLFNIIKSGDGLFKNGFKYGFDKNNAPQPYVNNNNISGIKSPNGVIEVRNIVENKNNSSINSSVSLMNSNNLQLKPI